MLLLLCSSAEAVDVLCGYCTALLRGWNAQIQHGRSAGVAWPREARLLLTDSGGWATGGGFDGFIKALGAAGWAVDRVALGQGSRRLAWGTALRSE